MSRLLLLLLLFPLWTAGCARLSSTRCHLYEQTASAPIVSAWDVSPSACVGHRILEQVDREGRVSELRFMNGDSLEQFTVYYPSRETFTYGDSTVVSEAFYDDGSVFGPEVDAPFRTTYRVRRGALIECRGEIAPSQPARPARAEVHTGPDRCGYITGYLYSRARMRGVNPVAAGFDWAGVRLPYGARILQAHDYQL